MRSRRIPRLKDIVGTLVAGLWPVAVTLAALRNPGSTTPSRSIRASGTSTLRPSRTADDRPEHLLHVVHAWRPGRVDARARQPSWWNPFQGLGAPLIGEMQSAGLFPFTPLLLLRDGSLIFHLSLLVVAGVATYWLLREFRFGPLISSAGAMVFATCGTFAWIANAAFNPVCFLPLLLLGVERIHLRWRARGPGGDGSPSARPWPSRPGSWRSRLSDCCSPRPSPSSAAGRSPATGSSPSSASSAAGVGLGLAVAAPVLVAFHDYISVGYLGTHTVDVAVGIWHHRRGDDVCPDLFGRIDANPFPFVQATWGAIGGYAGFGPSRWPSPRSSGGETAACASPSLAGSS